jgi:hypothetical protein
MDIGSEFLSALFAVMSAHAIGQLYRALQIGRPLAVVTKLRRAMYWALFALGIVFIGVVVALVLFFQSFLPDPVMGETTALRSEIQSMSLSAKIYALEHNGSFVGVCDTLRARITSADTVECNDSETNWAMQAESNSERWCADDATMGKLVQTPLDGRLSCLVLPDRQPLQTPTEVSTSTSSKE